MRSVEIEYTTRIRLELGISDYQYFYEEIENILEAELNKKGIYFEDIEEYDWCDDRPEPIESFKSIPDRAWFEIGPYTAATNGWAIILKDCPVDFINDGSWRNPAKIEEKTKEVLLDLLARDISAYPPHPGKFRDAFGSFKQFKYWACARQHMDM
jgi:hypothetical protein